MISIDFLRIFFRIITINQKEEVLIINSLLLKSLHSTLKLSITVCDRSFTVLTEYKSDKTVSLYYDHHLILNEFSKTKENFLFHSGFMGELFLALRTDNHYVIIGPWRSNAIDPLLFKRKMNEAHIENDEQNYFFEKLVQLPFFPLSQIRELLILVNYCLTGKIEDLLSAPLHHYTKGWSNAFDLNKIKQLSVENSNTYTYQYQYETRILQAVKSGKEELLRETVSQLSNAVSATLSGDELRSEKNYSIMIYDRLAQGAVHSGLDIETAYQSRDRFVTETEQAQSLHAVLKLRDTAILFYTQQVSGIKQKLVSQYSQTVIGVIQYLENNLNRAIKTAEIARQFHMSESKLRKLFKQEKHMTILQYFLHLKIEVAKQLLEEGKTLAHIAELLQFSTSANFSRTFKRVVGISPLKYAQQNNLASQQTSKGQTQKDPEESH